MPFLSFWRWVIGITSAPMSPHAEKWQGQLSYNKVLRFSLSAPATRVSPIVLPRQAAVRMTSFCRAAHTTLMRKQVAAPSQPST